MVLAHCPRGRIRATHQRKPDFHRSRRKHLRRHHADDGIKLATKVEGASQDAWVAWKTRCQSWSLITATKGPFSRSSSSVKTRPSCGFSPMTLKKLAVR